MHMQNYMAFVIIDTFSYTNCNYLLILILGEFVSMKNLALIGLITFILCCFFIFTITIKDNKKICIAIFKIN